MAADLFVRRDNLRQRRFLPEQTEAVDATCRKMLEGQAAPEQGHILSL